jgi:hypothetical protein
MKGTLKPPTITKDEKSPLVLELSAFIEHQGVIILQQAEQKVEELWVSIHYPTNLLRHGRMGNGGRARSLSETRSADPHAVCCGG